MKPSFTNYLANYVLIVPECTRTVTGMQQINTPSD